MLGFLEAGYGNILLAVICLLGIAGTWMAGRRYRRMTREMESLSGGQSKYLKQMRNKFETSYRVNRGVNNVGLFVERNVAEFRCLGIRLHRLENMAAGAGSLAFLLGCGAALFSYRAGMAMDLVRANLALSLLISAAAMLYWKNADVGRRARDFCIHIQDYLENVLSNRLAATAPREAGGADLSVKEYGERPAGETGQAEEVTRFSGETARSSGETVRSSGEMVRSSGEKVRSSGEEPMSAGRGLRPAEGGGLSSSGAVSFQESAEYEPDYDDRESHKEEIDYLRQSLDRIASGREPQEGGERRKRKKPRLSPEEQGLIEDILREYFA